MSEPSQSKLFTYEDGEGHIHVVDSLEKIPKKYRELAKEARSSLDRAKKVQRQVGDVAPFVKELDLPSVAVGFALSLGFVLVFSIVRRTVGLMLKLALLALIVFLVGGAYFGWINRASAFKDEAKRTVTQVQKRIDDQEKELKKIGEASP